MIKQIERRYSNSPLAAAQPTVTRAEGQEVEADDVRIVGYTAVFSQETVIPTMFGGFRETIKKGAFARAIAEEHDVRALRNHDADNLLGRSSSGTLTLREDDKGLWVEILPPNTELAAETKELIRRGDLSGMSFAFVITAEKWTRGKGEELDMREILDVDLYDVGPVTYPAYPQTTADLRYATELQEEAREQLARDESRDVREAGNESKLGRDALVASLRLRKIKNSGQRL